VCVAKIVVSHPTVYKISFKMLHILVPGSFIIKVRLLMH
jgi:hypothetical protein